MIEEQENIAIQDRPKTIEDRVSSDFFDSIGVERAISASPSPIPIPIPAPKPIPIPLPWLQGTRFMIWKQDPTVNALGRRLIYLPLYILNGPRDSRINTQLPGTTPVVRNSDGFIYSSNSKESDCSHAFAVVRATLTMYERHRNGAAIPWAWNTGGNTDVVSVYPRGFNGANAYYSRNDKSLKFGSFTPSGSTTEVHTCRSLDIVSHETGHAILDGLKPGWLGWGNPPQTGGLHEAFGDLTAIFLALSQLDQVEALIAITGADLHKKSFLKRLAEQFGLALGRPMGLRNADNDLKLSQVSNEVHAISQVFTGGVYDVLADIFNYEKYRQRNSKGPAHVLSEVGQHVAGLVFNAYLSAPNTGATFSDVVNQMLKISHNQGDPAIYRTFIRNRFTYREVVVSPTPLTAMNTGAFDFDNQDFVDGADLLDMDEALPNHPSKVAANQDRSCCCGTMQNPEFAQLPEQLEANRKKLSKAGVTLTEEDLLSLEIEALKKAFK